MKNALRALLAALAVLAGVFLIRHFQDRAAARPRLAYESLTRDSVAQVRIAYLGDSVTLRNGSRGWVTSGDQFPADTARVRRVLGYLLGLQTREIVARDDSGRAERLGLSEYGLDSTSARLVEWRLFSGRVFRVALGKVSGIDYGSSFWKPQDEAVVYRTPGTFVFEVSSRPKDWKDTNLYAAFRPGDIKGVGVTWRGPDGVSHRYALERNARDTGFVVTGAGGAPDAAPVPAAQGAASKIFTHAAQFKVDEFVSGFDSSAIHAGLDNPVMTVRITLKDGTVHLIEAGNAVDGLYRYIRHPTHSDPVRVFGWRFEYFRKRGEDFAWGKP